jgi:DNA-binding MarR family transcriptional regulator
MDKGQVSKVISRLVEMGMVRKGGEHGNQLFPIH